MSNPGDTRNMHFASPSKPKWMWTLWRQVLSFRREQSLASEMDFPKAHRLQVGESK